MGSPPPPTSLQPCTHVGWGGRALESSLSLSLKKNPLCTYIQHCQRPYTCDVILISSSFEICELTREGAVSFFLEIRVSDRPRSLCRGWGVSPLHLCCVSEADAQPCTLSPAHAQDQPPLPCCHQKPVLPNCIKTPGSSASFPNPQGSPGAGRFAGSAGRN